jgi:ABC-type multidrug transport system ATPase subunit
MIEADKLSRRFGRKHVLKDLTFKLDGGKVAVLGFNGAGKSTLAKIVAGILRPTEGKIRVFGEEPSNSSEVRKRIGVASHNPMLYRDLTVRENLEFFASVYSCKMDLKDLARKFGFLDYLDRKVSELSRGYVQRVSMAKAMLNEPDLLILDEITAGLDVEARNRVIEMAKGFKGSLLFTTHILEEAEFCDSYLVLKEGGLAYFGEDFERAVEILHGVH